ncbi:MAG TPA: class I SAM-dependent methyltransferase [Anaerolineae bacterium]|nr:class I SAM-dependent methyltransferase [Anaerolineae bacterium]
MQPIAKRQLKRLVFRFFEQRPRWFVELVREHPALLKSTLQAHPEWVAQFLQEHPRWTERWLDGRIQQRYQLPVPLDNYQSPLPDLGAVKQNLARWYRPSFLDPARWDLDKQSQFLRMLCPFKSEADALPTCVQLADEGYGLGYGEVEARILYSMVRYLKPRQVIEVGAGISSFFTLSALEVNRALDNIEGKLLCIEPYPSAKIRGLAAQGRLALDDRQVQDVAIRVFQTLYENDVLFIDSSHVAKIDSDVNWLYLDVLPRLNKGVVVQIHDIHFPYPTVRPSHPLFDLTLLWNEAALVQAFLMYNDAFEILLCESYLHHEHPAALKELVALYDPDEHCPSSVWIQRNT